jgi:hypothetical protein
MDIRSSASALAISLFLMGNSITTAENDKWLPLSRMEIMRVFQVLAVKEVRDSKTAPTDVLPLHAKGDTVWIGMDKNSDFRLAMAGRGNKVHSIRLYVPILNLSKKQSEETFKMLAAFFEAAMPRWAGAKIWPEESLMTSWSASGNAMDHKPFNREDIITKKTVDEITLSTFGVPPDIVLYGATARAECIPQLPDQESKDVRNDPIQRLVC